MLEHVCTFWHAVERKKYGHPVVARKTDELWDLILNKPEGTHPQSYLNNLPAAGLELKLSMQQNEMFVLGMEENSFTESLKKGLLDEISNYLFRVQKLTARDYYFRHHLETQIVDDLDSVKASRYYRIQSIKALIGKAPIKVKIDLLGNLSLAK